ncbi:cationic outer membrane protein OmpH [Deinococcus aetherius]|uniref:Cationic outer membrane protein OmpH n=1 Tax=Deinococcus aetherius TaxID=200252 RepID=A0ABN6RCL1_9DEIO|nr:OmpH family outer membrane protein [Deinococcus aetherius]BDP41098.1 cationic outer membrane protein OmpH [Deinococcus aetherius]
MKINAKALAPLAIVAAFGLGTLAPHAQTTPQKIAFVDVQRLLAAHPADKDLQAIQQKANTELSGLQKQIQAIDAKGAQATAAEKQNRATLVSTLQAKAKTYDDQMKPKMETVEKAVDAAVNSTAKANGYSIVMDRGVAARSGLVVYADNSTDITEATLKAVK